MLLRSAIAYLLALLTLPVLATPEPEPDASIDRSATSAYDVVGEAYSLEDQRLLYREYHRLGINGLTREVRYLTPENQLLAEKHLQYPGIHWQPSFQQIDYRLQQSLRVSVDSAALRVDINSTADTSSAARTSEQLQSEIALDKIQGLVVDAGFDAFVKAHWPALQAGESLVFDFVLPSRQRVLGLRIQQDAAPHCENSAAQLCLKISANSWLLRAIVQPIWLTYARDSRRLIAFEGLGNLPDAKGDGQFVRIIYRYQDNNGLSFVSP